MHLAFHPDWPAAQQRLEAFWRGERLDRPAMFLTASRPEPRPVPQPRDPDQMYFDADFLYRRCQAELSNVHHLAEALPCARGLLCGWLPAYGSRLRAEWDTIWFEPLVDDWANAPDWDAWDQPQYHQLKAIVREVGDRAAGQFHVGMPPMLPPNDLVAVLRGTQQLALDLVLQPEAVEDAFRRVTRSFIARYHDLAGVVARHFEGLYNHYPLWGRQVVTLQSDISCMISAAQYERFIVPELEVISTELGPAIYHVDGEGAIRHLDRLCRIPGIKVIQWVPGAGRPQGFEHWPQVFGRAQELGRAIYLPIGAGQLETAIREFRPELTFLLLHARDLATAEELLRQAEVWTRKYWG